MRGHNPRRAAGRARLVEHQRPSRLQQRVQAVQHLRDITDKESKKCTSSICLPSTSTFGIAITATKARKGEENDLHHSQAPYAVDVSPVAHSCCGSRMAKICSAVRGRLESPRAPPGWRPAAAPSRRIQRPASEHHPPTRTCMAQAGIKSRLRSESLVAGPSLHEWHLTRYNCTGVVMV